ncbi:branched-chain-amino-acid aminotransferase-like protein 2 [Gastrolobium bilobum]|uniref:branched-chain-amino-acid aminotransferase-like protein 2 n=1 Tax=Gastrolobium bilobum TaxID=150636 RepID=UPI002AB22523|nr:branched-chain-amino-acid aminotransferase-like protein 2 [Gastrolobium bilobum]
MAMSEVEVIHSWSAPRSLSTSLMYSFAQRDDIEVLAEPLCANFLRVTGLDRPYREELLSKMESDGNKVINDMIFGPRRKKYRFLQIEGNNAKADDAIMLDQDGYLSETNATNIFIVKRGRVLTPHADYCLPGITRATVMELVVKEQLILEERRISLSKVHTTDEIWTTGTMGELSPIVKVDGRIIGNGEVGPVIGRLQAAYKKLTEQSGIPIPTYLKT